MDRLAYRDDTGRALLTHYGMQMYCSTQATADCFAKLEESIPRWIPVKDRLPEKHESIFHRFFNTPRWSSAMWKQESDKVLVCVSFPDGTSVVTTGCLHDSDWVTTVSNALPQTVTHWMPLPEQPKEE